jgi:hypothetical protein
MTHAGDKAGAQSAGDGLLVEEQGPWLARRARREDATRPSDRIALGSALGGGLLVAVLVAARLAFSGGESRVNTNVLGISGTSQPVHVQAGAQAQPTAASPAAPGSTTATPDNTELAHVTNTQGQSVVLRASPREDDRTPRGFMDGDPVTVLERSGADWARVRGDNGREGWVPRRYLAP